MHTPISRIIGLATIMLSWIPTIAAMLILVDPSFCFAGSVVYAVKEVADSHAIGGLGLSTPAINNAGNVAFVSTDPSQSGLLVGTAGSLTSIFPSSLQFANSGPGALAPSINDAGTVATVVGGPSRVISGSGAAVTTISSSSSPPVGGIGGYSGVAINNSGRVSFIYSHIGGVSGVGVFEGSGGPLTTLGANANGSVGLPSTAASRSADVTAFVWATFDQFNNPTARFLNVVSNGATILTVPESDIQGLAVNSTGDVAGSIGAGFGSELGIYVASGGPLVKTIGVAQGFNGFGSVSINDQGALAFLGSKNSVDGIYAGPSLDRVIQVGDQLAGATVLSLSFGNEGLNNTGEIAFFATLDDGHQGIFVATPVPEPSSLILGGFGVITLLAFRLRR